MGCYHNLTYLERHLLAIDDAYEAERIAYAEGLVMSAELFGRIAELESRIEELENANEYKKFFRECFSRLGYPSPHVESDYDKSFIFDLIDAERAKNTPPTEGNSPTHVSIYYGNPPLKKRRVRRSNP